MKYKVTLRNEAQGLNTTIEVGKNQYIQKVAKENGIDLPLACDAGACSYCAGKVIEGKVSQPRYAFLDKEQIKQGYALLCVATPKSDCIILTDCEDDLYQL